MVQTISVEGIITNFPIPVLPIIVGEQNLELLIAIHTHIFENNISAHSNMGGGFHVHLVLIIPITDYQSHIVHAFITTNNTWDLHHRHHHNQPLSK